MKSFDTDGDFKDNYKFLIGSIVPRPIAVVSTLNENGSNNLAPFSFFTACSAKPMIVAFCPLIRVSTGEKKDTVINIEREKEFVINFARVETMEKINLCATELEYGKDEFELSGLTPVDSEIVKAKRVAESLIHFECKLHDINYFGKEAGAGSIIFGEVVKVHVDESVLDSGRILTDILNPIGRGAGNDWVKCTDLVQLDRLTTQIQK
jgi:flavin reductase (DIM6/NTAB) family NADH-FMN oxidoreductase RutF